MDASHSRLLTPSGYCQADPSTALRAGPGPAAQRPAACALRPELASVAIGRSFTRMTLRSWDLAELSAQAELVVSELVTNAIRHGLVSARRIVEEYPVGLRLLAQASFVTCMVTDPGSQLPVRAPAGSLAESGRGLQVVESCSVRWGWQPLDAGGKVVWALLEQELSRRTRSAAARFTPAGSRSRRPWRRG